MSEEIRQQVNDIIEADIQLKINDYIEKQGKGFKGEELRSIYLRVKWIKLLKSIKELKKVRSLIYLR